MAEVISETEVKVYVILRDNPVAQFTTGDLAARIGVGVRAVQRRLARLSDVIETLPTKPPKHRILVQGRAGKVHAKKLDDVAKAYGLVQETKG